MLLKYGAARSWLLRENRAEPLGCGTLPAGMDPEEGPEKHVFTLHPGERLLLVSDGVADPEHILKEAFRESPAALSGLLMDRSDDRDDRTVLLVSAMEAP